MSDGPDQPAERWLNPLADLLNRWNELDQKGRRNFVNTLCRALRGVNCYRLIGWVVEGEPAPDLSEEAEMAALRATLRALECDHDDPTWSGSLTPDQRRALRELRRRAVEPAKERLRHLEGEAPTAPEDADCLVTLDQAAAMVSRSKRTLEHYKRHKTKQLPDPDSSGGGGRADEWKWSTIRPWLEQVFNRKLPERYPRRRPSR
jgi:hypothetical protein